MVKIDRNEFESLVRKGEEKFSYRVEPTFMAKFQLFLTGKITKGVEIFGIGPLELRAFGFLYEYGRQINLALRNNYRVFIKKEGTYFGKGTWNLEFTKRAEQPVLQ